MSNYEFATNRSLINHAPVIETGPSDTFKSLLKLPENANRFGEGGLRLKDSFKERNSLIPLITIITAVYNGKEHLEEVIESVLKQQYSHVELIIIDGGSSDGTLELLKQYDHAIDYWVSEKDKGISDAFNKGIQLALGHFINFQGDGDGLIGPDALSRLFAGISSETQLVCGRILRVDAEGRPLYVSKYLPKFRKQSLLFKMSLPHQALFTNLKFFKRYGLFDEKNKFAMDYEHLLRAYHDFPEVVTRDLTVAKWRADGVGEGRTPDILKEYDLIKRKNKIASTFVLDLINQWSFIKFNLKSYLGKA